MTQSLVTVVIFIALLATLPGVIKRLKNRQKDSVFGTDRPTRLISTLPIGPAQRIITVEVGSASQRNWLVIGVTAQNMQCLHVLQAPIDCEQASDFLPVKDKVISEQLHG